MIEMTIQRPVVLHCQVVTVADSQTREPTLFRNTHAGELCREAPSEILLFDNVTGGLRFFGKFVFHVETNFSFQYS